MNSRYPGRGTSASRSFSYCTILVEVLLIGVRDEKRIC